MTRRTSWLFVATVLSTCWLATSAAAQTPNPAQIALLKWFPAYQEPISFSTGINPLAVAFDGSSIWTANEASGSVSKIRASDGASLGTFSVGRLPVGLAFDGANMWVTNYNSTGQIYKLRASDGSNQGVFATGGAYPFGVAFDGANLWIANYGSNTVTKLRASDGTILGIFAAGTAPVGVAFDGTNIWVTNYSPRHCHQDTCQ